MKVLNLRCANGHGFEGWFGSEDDFMDQNGRTAIECPLCGDHVISRMPSAPRLNLNTSRGSGEPPAAPSSAPASSGASAAAPASNKAPAGREPAEAQVQAALPADLQAAWLQTVRHLMDNTEDVGGRFAEEARRMHYGEEPQRGIRGQASPEEREALRDEGIETMSIPLPRAIKGPVQ